MGKKRGRRSGEGVEEGQGDKKSLCRGNVPSAAVLVLHSALLLLAQFGCSENAVVEDGVPGDCRTGLFIDGFQGRIRDI